MFKITKSLLVRFNPIGAEIKLIQQSRYIYKINESLLCIE